MKNLYKNILVGVDGSENAEQALQRAIQFSIMHEAKLHIAHIIDTRALNNYATINYNYSDLINEETVNALNDYKNFALDNGVKEVDTIVEYGSPRTLMSKTIPDEYDIDLVIVGATGLNAVERMFIGSVSEQIVRQASCDVIIVRNEHENTEPIPRKD
ncbi:MAG: universal stress protein [Atopococcus tabaci]|uniref:Universal stress protein n=1 Tax=Atopococcus tabaci TaxID=269774 RepID=A0AA43UD61_9LACT|nr:universal stress protein [Atopococcus tabaci]